MSDHKNKKKRELPPLFWYMEMGDWEKASERLRRHPREVKVWATLRTKSSLEDSSSSMGSMSSAAGAGAAAGHHHSHRSSAAAAGGGGGGKSSSSTKRLALHHACFKLRSAGSLPASPKSSDDTFVQACRFILLLIRLYPEAAGQRESRHGCLPIHLAAFASCSPRSPAEVADDKNKKNSVGGSSSATTNTTAGSTLSSSTMTSFGAAALQSPSQQAQTPRSLGSSAAPPSPATLTTTSTSSTTVAAANNNNNNNSVSKPEIISRRVASDATTGTMETNLSAVHAEEAYTGAIMGDKDQRQQYEKQQQRSGGGGGRGGGGSGVGGGRIGISLARSHSSVFIPPKREEMAVQVVNALLDAYPKGIRVDSEGGRLPLHTACAGRATPRVVSTLVTAYPSAARHRNKDGFLPLHLAAHWGVSHPNVAVTLLKAYPDATVGRNRWERTPLEEALVMAGENGRPHQAALVRALRKHPNYWAHPLPLTEMNEFRQKSAPVDIDESLPSGESSSEDIERQRYLQYGQQYASVLLSPEDEREARESQQKLARPAPTTIRAVSAPMNPTISTSATTKQMTSMLRRLSPSLSPKRGGSGGGGAAAGEREAADEEEALALGFSLEALVQNRRWKTALARLQAHPLEAEQDLEVTTRGGFSASSGFTPLHYACERQPPVEAVQALIELHPAAVTTRTLPGGALPLHVACTWYGSADTVNALLSADQTAATVPDELGNLALHSACFSGADAQVIERLLQAFPKAVLARNNQGSRPMDICKRLRHENRRAIMALLTLQKEEIMAKHRRTNSQSTSGTWSEVASAAIELNERSERSAKAENGFREADDMQEQGGVEVSYNEDENRELLWI